MVPAHEVFSLSVKSLPVAFTSEEVLFCPADVQSDLQSDLKLTLVMQIVSQKDVIGCLQAEVLGDDCKISNNNNNKKSPVYVIFIFSHPARCLMFTHKSLEDTPH